MLSSCSTWQTSLLPCALSKLPLCLKKRHYKTSSVELFGFIHSLPCACGPLNSLSTKIFGLNSPKIAVDRKCWEFSAWEITGLSVDVTHWGWGFQSPRCWRGGGRDGRRANASRGSIPWGLQQRSWGWRWLQTLTSHSQAWWETCWLRAGYQQKALSTSWAGRTN